MLQIRMVKSTLFMISTKGQAIPSTWPKKYSFGVLPNIAIFLLIHTIYATLLSIIKLTGKRTDITQVKLNERLLYLQCGHYRTTN